MQILYYSSDQQQRMTIKRAQFKNQRKFICWIGYDSIENIIKYKNNSILTEMGSQQSANNTSIINTKFLKSLSSSTPLKNLDNFETEVHQIACLSPEHHQIMLQKIRIKKNYDCPYILRIIDSHTLQSKNLCSTIIKTYIVVEKPQCLAQEIQHRIQIGLGFEEPELWTLIYSCSMAGAFLLRNNVGLIRVNASRVFVDVKGGIKINDPDFSEGSMGLERVSQRQFIQSLQELCEQLMSIKKSLKYSDHILELLRLMSRKYHSFSQIQNFIKTNYLQQKKENHLVDGFSSTKKNRTLENSTNKSKPRKLSGRKISVQCSNINKSHLKNTSQFTNYQSLISYREDAEQKQNVKENQGGRSRTSRMRSQVQLYTFKDELKNMESLDTKQLSLQSHLFPRKALFGQRKRGNQRQKQSEASKCTQPGCQSSRTTNKEVLTRESHSMIAQTDPSLDGSQLLNMISSYQVDKETFVREVCQEQSEYFLELMNNRKLVPREDKYQQI